LTLVFGLTTVSIMAAVYRLRPGLETRHCPAGSRAIVARAVGTKPAFTPDSSGNPVNYWAAG
jgi:hypothetical protein